MPKSKTAAKTEPKTKSYDPFIEAYDHVDELGIEILNSFLQSIELPRDQGLAYHILHIIEDGCAKDDSMYETLEGLHDKFPKKFRSHKTRKDKYAKTQNTNINATIEKEAAQKALLKETGQKVAELESEESEHGEQFRTIRAELTELRKERKNLRNPGPYKPRYPNNGSGPGTIDKDDWAQVTNYFATRVANAPKREKNGAYPTSPDHDNLLMIADYLGVSPLEKRFLTTIYALEHCTFAESFFEDLTRHVKPSVRKCLARILGITTTELAKLLNDSGSLQKKCLIETDPDNEDGSFMSGIARIDPRIDRIIEEPDISMDSVIDRMLGTRKTARRKWADYATMGEQPVMLKRFVEGCVNNGEGASILLVSDFGIGKSTMIEALCTELGVDLYVPGEEEMEGDVDENGRPLPAPLVRFNAWKHGSNLLAARYRNGGPKRAMSALFMDEIGDLLAGGGMGRQTDGSYAGGAVSRLQAHQAVEFPGVITFFAGNNETQWDPAILSRMDLIIHLRTPDRAHRQKIWQIQTIEQRMDSIFNAEDIRKLAEELEIPARLIEKAVSFAKRTDGGVTEAMFYLKNQCEILFGGIENVAAGHKWAAPFHPELLTPKSANHTELNGQIATIQTAISQHTASVHIAGPDGTGKNLLARYFSDHAGKKMRTIEAGDFLAQTPDGTSANIRRIFREAAEDGIILHLHGIDDIINQKMGDNSGISGRMLVRAVSETLGEQLRRNTVSTILTSRFTNLSDMSPDLATAFGATIELGYLGKDRIDAAITKLNGAVIEGVRTTEPDITPADIADALRQTRQMGTEPTNLGPAIDRASIIRRNAGEPYRGYTL